MEKFHSTQDEHSSASFLFISAFRWLGLWTELTVAVFYLLVLVTTMLLPENGMFNFNYTLGIRKEQDWAT